jgi:GDP-fucose protein O-fucosyltransferase
MVRSSIVAWRISMKQSRRSTPSRVVVGQWLLRCLGIVWIALIVAFVFGTIYLAVIVEQVVIGEGPQPPLLLGPPPRGPGRTRKQPERLASAAAAEHRTATLTCSGLSSEQSNEMVYWQDIPSDHAFQSPFFVQQQNRPANDEEEDTKDDAAAAHGRRQSYLTFVMDEGGYNNIRMAYETVLALSHAMGRTLVLPPNQEMYLLNDGGGRPGQGGQQQQQQQQQQRKDFGFQDFFPIERIAAQIQGMSIISTEEFLVREAMNGTLRDRQSGQVSFPPHNRTNWDGDSKAIIKELQPWLETVSYQPDWSPDVCLAAFPAEPGNSLLEQKFSAILNLGGFRTPESYVANPTAVYGNTIDRLGEVLNGRTHLCVYNETNERLLHLHGKQELGTRLLTHFYAFLFFEDWQQDLWTKRFIRDQLHYRDEIQCAAARIVAAIRSNNSSTRGGPYDAFHVRRGEFQYQRTRVTAQELYEMVKEQIPANATVYIATDERDRRFFDDLAVHYHLLFLDDFHHLLTDVNTNLYGLIDQLVASRSRTFFGCWFSTYVPSSQGIGWHFSQLSSFPHSFTSYINRLRGCKVMLSAITTNTAGVSHFFLCSF